MRQAWRWQIIPAFLCALVLSLAAISSCPAAGDPARDKDSYERLLAIILTGSKENKEAAKASLKQMGEAGVALLKADCANLDSPRGALAWSLLKEAVDAGHAEVLLDFARNELLDVARNWNAACKGKGSGDRAQKTRLHGITSDFVTLLAASNKHKDFELLLKALASSLIVGDAKIDFGADFDVWDRLWKTVNDRVKASDSARDLQAWQATLDGQFRRYSLMKGYADRKTIQAYHTATLVLMSRLGDVMKKPAPPAKPAEPPVAPEPPVAEPAPPDAPKPPVAPEPPPDAPDETPAPPAEGDAK